MLKKRYINEFTDREKEIFTRIENDKERWSAMSIYAYFKKMFIKAETEELEVSYRDFLKKYKHHHKKISLDTLGRRVRRIVEIGLLTLIKKGQKHIYKLAAIDNKSDSLSYSFSYSKNCPQSVDITCVEEGYQIPNTKYYNKDIYNKYISASEADAICNEVIKELDIKRKIVKNAIKLRIKQFANRINQAGAYQYIMKVAIDTYNFFRISSERANKIATILMNKKKAKEQKKKGSFCNYNQREYTQKYWDELDEAIYANLNDWSNDDTAKTTEKPMENEDMNDMEAYFDDVVIKDPKTDKFEDDEDLLGWDE